MIGEPDLESIFASLELPKIAEVIHAKRAGGMTGSRGISGFESLVAAIFDDQSNADAVVNLCR